MLPRGSVPEPFPSLGERESGAGREDRPGRMAPGSPKRGRVTIRVPEAGSALIDGEGRQLNAHWSCATAERQAWVVLESRSGAFDSPSVRNPDYIPALRLLLQRLQDLDARLERVTREPTAGRDAGRVFDLHLDPPFRLPLRLVATSSDLRHALSRAQGGNQVRRIRLHVELARPMTPSGLEAVLARGGTGPWTKAYWHLRDVDAATAAEVAHDLGAEPDSLETCLLIRSYEGRGPAYFAKEGDLWTLTPWGKSHPPTPRPGGSKRWSDAERNRAVELHAMEAAIRFFSTRGDVVDRSANRPYDLEVKTADGLLFVEVKGTTGSGARVMLTAGEVRHARSHPSRCALFVVTHVKLAEDGFGHLHAVGGTSHVVEDWQPQDLDLHPTKFRYEVPAADNLGRSAP